jgi:hypothetical protein
MLLIGAVQGANRMCRPSFNSTGPYRFAGSPIDYKLRNQNFLL